MAISTNGTVLARLAGGLYNTQMSNATYKEVAALDPSALADVLYSRDFATVKDSVVATTLVTNLGLTAITGLDNWIAAQLTAAGTHKGAKIVELLNSFANMTADATYGSYATAFNNKVDAALALSQATDNVGGTFNTSGSTTTKTFTLTAGVDAVSANQFIGTLSNYSYNGVGSTLNFGDSLTGTGTDAKLSLYDTYASANDVIPYGVKLTNISNIELFTQGNAGNGNLSSTTVNGGIGAAFDTTKIAGVKNVYIEARGVAGDQVNAAQTTDVTVRHLAVGSAAGAGFVTINGGNNVTVNTVGNGSVAIGQNALGEFAGDSALPAGDVSVSQGYGNVINNSILAALGGAPTDTGGGITVYGGKNVTVTSTNPFYAGEIVVGDANDYTKASHDPSGNISVDSKGFGAVTVQPSATTSSVVVKDAAGYEAANNITIGDSTGTIVNTIAAITVTNSAAVPYNHVAPSTTAKQNNNNAADVSVYGGGAVNVTTNSGSVTVGNGLKAVNGTNSVTQSTDPTGAITIVNTATDSAAAGTATVSVNVSGGGSGDITITANNDVVKVGKSSTGAQNSANKITVTETSSITGPNLYGGSHAAPSITIDGGTDVTVTAKGQNIAIGNTDPTGLSPAQTSNSGPTGAITVTESSVLTGRGLGAAQGAITANGGTSVTVNSTGGSVAVGARVIPGTTTSGIPSGAVTINDTYGGAQNDAFSVIGGSSVNITTTKTSGALTVGDTTANKTSITLNTAGTALAYASTAAQGNVVYSSMAANGVYNVDSTSVSNLSKVQTMYGTSAGTVYTNNATSVSLTGVAATTIKDVQSTLLTAGLNSGKAAGTSTLATVSLTGYSDASTIASDALTTLNLADGSSSVTVTDNSTAAHAGTITLNRVTGGTITDNSIGALTVTSAGTATNTGITISDTGLTSATFTNAAPVSVTLTGPTTGFTSITATNSGTLGLGDLSGFSRLASVNASTATGAVTATINPSYSAFTGGAGNDTVTITQYSNVNATSGLSMATSGGAGTDKLIANYVAAASQVPSALYSGFETLYLGTLASSASAAYDATGFTTIGTGSTVAANVTFSNVAAGVPLNVEADPSSGKTIKVNLALSTGSSDALTINLGKSTTAAAVNFRTIDLSDSAASSGIETVTINSQGTGALQTTNINTVALTDTNNVTKTLNFTGAEALAVTSASTSVNVLNASTATGNVDASAVVLKNASATITGGAGLFTADLTNVGASATRTTQTYADSVTSGSGGVTLTLGTGGQWSSTASAGSQNGANYIGAPANGSETVNLAASVAAKDTIKVPNATVSVTNNTTGGITGFTSLNSTSSDQLVLLGTGTNRVQTADIYALKNVSTATNVGNLDSQNLALGVDPSGALSAKLVNLLYTASNGVITFSTVAGHNLTEFAATDLMHAAELIVDYSAEAPISVTGDGSAAGISFSSGATSATVSSATNLAVGQVISATGIPAGTTITAITGTTLTLSASTTAAATYATFNAAYGSVANANSNRVAAMFSTGGNTYVVSSPDATPTYTPAGITQTVTQPTLTITHAVAGSVTTGTVTVVVNGTNVTTAAIAASATPTTVAAAIVTAMTAAGVVGVTATNSGAVVTFSGASTVSLGAVSDTGVTGTAVNKTITTADTNAIVQMNGVTGLTGFGGLQTATTLYTGDTAHLSVLNNVAPALTQGGTSAARTISATGYSSLDGTSLGTIGTTSTAVTGLAPSAQLAFGSNTDLKAFSVTQSGAAGSNAIAVTLGASQTAGTLTLNGDWLATLTGGTGGSVLTGLTDGGGAAATLTDLKILGANAVTVSKITDAALTTIDARTASGALVLGDGTPLSNANLKVLLETASAAAQTVNTTGDGVSITQATGAGTGALTINASGANNTISITTTGNQSATIQASGAGDTFTSIGGGTGTTVIGAVVSAGAPTVPTSQATFNFIGNGTKTAWVGAGSTVNLGGTVSGTWTEFTGTANVKVSGDVYVPSTGSGLVTVTGVPHYLAASTGGHLNVDFTTSGIAVSAAGSSFGASQVNVSGITALADALNLAANYSDIAQTAGKTPAATALLDWFQFGGDTYIVAGVNTGAGAAEHTGLGANDIVVKLAGLVDLSAVTLASSTLAVF